MCDPSVILKDLLNIQKISVKNAMPLAGQRDR